MQVSYHSTNVSRFQLRATSYEKQKTPKGMNDTVHAGSDSTAII